jgi:hypothetical protein
VVVYQKLSSLSCCLLGAQDDGTVLSDGEGVLVPDAPALLGVHADVPPGDGHAGLQRGGVAWTFKGMPEPRQLCPHHAHAVEQWSDQGDPVLFQLQVLVEALPRVHQVDAWLDGDDALPDQGALVVVALRLLHVGIVQEKGAGQFPLKGVS